MTSPLKKAAFWIVMILLTWLTIECAALVGYRAINHTWFSYSEAISALSSSAPTDSSEFILRGLADLKMGDFVEVLHPYFGFVAEPQQNKKEWKVSDFGFPLSDTPSPVTRKAPNKVIVGVFGGSFTQWVYLSLKPILERRGRETGKEFVVLNFGIGGHKQPQQLMILNYLLAIGAEFDVVINIDGFNEVMLPASENIPNNVNPYYPRAWDKRTAAAVNAPSVRLIGRREEVKERKERWANSFRKHRLYLSPTLFLIWQARDHSFARIIYATNQRIAAEGAKSQSYTMRGPAYTFSEPDQLYRDLVAVWKRSSLQMKNLCEANGIRYHHFLQPNQYVAGSKPMNGDEARKAINPASPYKEAIEHAYPEMEKAIADLQKQGVAAEDLTQIYSNHPEPIYIDDCCHTNTEGSEIVAKRILETVFPK
jgi:hypothetical protein